MLIALIPFDYLAEDLDIYKYTSSAWAMNGMVVTGHICNRVTKRIEQHYYYSL